MPQGKGTYGTKKGRPPKKKKPSRKDKIIARKASKVLAGKKKLKKRHVKRVIKKFTKIKKKRGF